MSRTRGITTDVEQRGRKIAAERDFVQLEAGLRRLTELDRRDTGLRSRTRTAVQHAAHGVLRHSSEESQLEIARETVRELAIERTEFKLDKEVVVLRRHGARISQSAVQAASREIGLERAEQTINEAEAGRLRLPGER